MFYNGAPIHTPESFGNKPYALVRLVNNGTELYVRLSWFHRIQLARRAQPDTVLLCYYAPDLEAIPYFRYIYGNYPHGFDPTMYKVYEVNVIQIVEGDLKLQPTVPTEKAQPSIGSEDVTSIKNHKLQAETNLSKALENAKSVQQRLSGLTTVCELLAHDYLPETCASESTKQTICQLVERSLQRGKDAERALASQIVTLLALQLDDSHKLATAMGPLLLQTAQDSTATSSTRARACSALALTGVQSKFSVDQTLQTMREMETIFAGAYQNTSSTPDTELHLAALQAWAVLLTLIPAADVCTMMGRRGARGMPSMKKLIGLLQSQNLDLRIATGDTIALIVEIGRQHDSGFLDEQMTDLTDLFEQLSIDSQKICAKNDLKLQRSKFGHLLAYIRDGKISSTTIQFGSERLEIRSWKMQTLYAAYVRTIGRSLTVHLTSNDFLRKLFALGPPLRIPTPGELARNRLTKKLSNKTALRESSRLRVKEHKKKCEAN